MVSYTQLVKALGAIVLIGVVYPFVSQVRPDQHQSVPLLCETNVVIGGLNNSRLLESIGVHVEAEIPIALQVEINEVYAPQNFKGLCTDEILKWGRTEEMKAICSRSKSRMKHREPLFKLVDDVNAGTLHYAENAIVQHQGKIFMESGASVQSTSCCYCADSNLDLLTCEPCRRAGGAGCQTLPAVFSISTVYGGNMAHYFKESLPRLFPWLEWLHKRPDIFIHVNMHRDNNTHYILQSLAILGIPAPRVTWGDVYAKRVYIPAFTSCGKTVDQFPRTLMMRDALLSRTTFSKSSRTPRTVVVIERRTATRDKWDPGRYSTIRQAAHEAVQRVSNIADFRVIPFSDADDDLINCFKCQIELFSDAIAVVGQHGAGMTNIMFMRPGGLVIELGWSSQQTEYLLHAFAFRQRYNFVHWNNLRNADSLKSILADTLANYLARTVRNMHAKYE